MSAQLAYTRTTADLGPATEARIAAAFDKSCVITAKAAAALLGMDVKTLDRMAGEGIIRAVRRGELRAYTEGDIRAYLTESPGPCPSTSQPRAPTSNTTSRSEVSDFMARRALKRAEQQKN